MRRLNIYAERASNYYTGFSRGVGPCYILSIREPGVSREEYLASRNVFVLNE